MTVSLALLRHNRKAAPVNYPLFQSIADMYDHRSDYLSRPNCDLTFCQPDANWHVSARNDYQQAYLHLRSTISESLDYLRFYTQVFTGFNLMAFRPGEGLNSIEPVPSDLDERLLCTISSDVVDRWITLARGTPWRFRFSAPAVMGEIGFLVDGVIVNQDTVACQERLAALFELNILERLLYTRSPVRVLEIGAGYGALALAFHQIYDELEYTICDLPEALLFSGMYLNESGFHPRLVPNYRFSELVGEKFDLVINTLSMAEMSEHQVDVYARGISKVLDEDAVFFEQNMHNKGTDWAECESIIGRHLHLCPANKLDFPVTQGTVRVWSNGEPVWLRRSVY